MVVVVLLVASTSAAALERASTLDEWFDAIKIEVQTDYEETFSGVEVEVEDMECEELDVDTINAEYRSGTTLRLEVGGLDAECEGDYEWKYGTLFGNVRGDGKVEAKLRNSDVRIDLVLDLDAAGAPYSLRATNCRADITLRDISTRGDALGDFLDLFVDSFGDVLASSIESLVCDSLEDFITADLTSLVRSAGLEACTIQGGAEEEARIAAAEGVAWQAAVENSTGPGASLIAEAYRAAGEPSARELFGAGLDFAARFDLPIVSAAPLEVDGPFEFFRTNDEKKDAADRWWYLLASPGSCGTVVDFRIQPALCVASPSQQFEVRGTPNATTTLWWSGWCLGVDGTFSEDKECATNLVVCEACEEPLSFTQDPPASSVAGEKRTLIVLNGTDQCLDGVSLRDCGALLTNAGNATRYGSSAFWSFKETGGFVVNDGSGLCLVDGVTLAACADADAQRWRYLGGILTAYGSGKCVGSDLTMKTTTTDSCGSFVVFRYFLEEEEEDESSPALLSNASIAIKNVTATSSIPLSQIGIGKLRASLDARGLGSSAAFSAGLETAEFYARGDVGISFAINDLGDWVVQSLACPILNFDASLAATVGNASIRGVGTLIVVPRDTRRGLAEFRVGQSLDADCVAAGFRVRDCAVERLEANYSRSNLLITRISSSDDDDLETQIGQNVIPAIIKLVDLGLRDFVDCAVDRQIDALAEDATTRLRRELVAVSNQSCGPSSSKKQQGVLVKLNESELVRRAAREVHHVDALDVALGVLEALEEEDASTITIAEDGGRARIGVLDTTVTISKVFASDLKDALTNLTIFPGGVDALLSERRVSLLGAELNGEFTVGATVLVDSPVGKATIRANVSIARSLIEDLFVDAWIDQSALERMNWGTDLGLNQLFTRKGDFPLPACLASTVQAVAIRSVRAKIGSVGSAASADVEGLDDVVNAALRTAVGLVRDYVDFDTARREAIWLANDAIDAQLSTARETCLELSPNAPVADRQDRRGSRPSETSKGATGQNETLASTVDFLSVLLIVVVMFFAFGLIWFRRKALSGSSRMLAALVSKARGLMTKPPVHPEEEEEDALHYVENWLGGPPPPPLPEENHSLFAASDAPRPAKYALLCVILMNAAVLASSNVALAAQARVRLDFRLLDGKETIWLGTDTRLSLVDSVAELWRAGSILLAFLVALLSGAWPYVELSILLWGYTRRNLSPRRREFAWRMVEMLSKWSFIDVFIVVFLIVGFYVDLEVDAEREDASFRARVFVEARYAFYAFCLATFTSMCLGQILLNLHRRVHGLGRDRFSAFSGAVFHRRPSSEQQEENNNKAAVVVAPLRAPLCCHPLKGKPPRWWQRLVGPAVLAAGALLVASLTLVAVEFEIGGAVGFAIDVSGNESDRFYTAPGLARALASTTPNDAWRPLVRLLEAYVLFFACVAPLVHVALLAVLWLVPLAPPAQLRLLALSDTAYGWSSLDVYLVAILATATQTAKLADSLAKDQCEDVDGYLDAFFDRALDGDNTCFRLGVHVRPGCVVLALACCAQMVLGYLAASVTATAIGERALQAALGASLVSTVTPISPSVASNLFDEGKDEHLIIGAERDDDDDHYELTTLDRIPPDDDDDDHDDDDDNNNV
ncbi:hypothetical protein CTAYLR_008318 [Chrysophaeum taylorii]|uniref:Uncharacterized protein n=1 Tax=Chrysophaeum taylorii TaxID=2483200 RepID=A0AAD7U9E7_9STRA|nr:hypothetical protein CTAYLR_008318 [Chrysophaeum taylorii]